MRKTHQSRNFGIIAIVSMLNEIALLLVCKSAVDYPLATVWFWTFYILLFYICLNMLLAIVMDAYSAVKEESMGSCPSISEDVMAVGQMSLQRCSAFFFRSQSRYTNRPLTYAAMASLLTEQNMTSSATIIKSASELGTLLGVSSWLAESLFDECDQCGAIEDEAELERQVRPSDVMNMERRIDEKLDLIVKLMRASQPDVARMLPVIPPASSSHA
eukprot:SAG11_NODE_562_length_8523_cov_38.875356_3_plen_216_part_00